MKLSTKGRYAVTAMCDLARHGQGRPMSLADIADRQDISLSYLEQIFARLRQAGMVKSVRGPGGGYLPARGLESITVAEIMAAVGDGARVRASSNSDPESSTNGAERCPTHDLWEQLGNQIRWFLSRVSVEDVLQGRVPGAVGANRDPSAVPAAAD